MVDSGVSPTTREGLTDLGFAPIDLGDLAGGGRLHQVPAGPLIGQDLVRLSDRRAQ
ncbi:MAG TPA: hypothetical protein VM347_27825 [Nonomuraea sp.]|nr:hypothetical protein [Nonomuraea sp.]